MRSRLSPRAQVIVAVAVVVVAALVAASFWLFSGGGGAVAAKSTTATVKRGTVTVTASAAGTVTPVDSRALTFGTSGTVATLGVKAGDHVTSGEVLATLDPADAQAAVTSAQSALDAAETNLSLAEQQAATPTPTRTSRPTPTPTPTGTHSRGGGSTCPTSGSGGSGTGSGRGGQQSTGSDPLLRAQQSVNNAELALEQAEAKLAGTTITSPMDGRVLSVAGAVGETAQSGGSGFIVLGGADSLAVQAEFSEADVAGIQVGQQASVTLADHPGTAYAGTVTEIDPAGTRSGQLVRYGVQVSFTTPPADLLLGQSADVVVTTDSVPGALYVPAAALTSTGTDTATVVVRTGTGDATRTVTTGVDGDQGTQIVSGLNEGDVVVIVG